MRAIEDAEKLIGLHWCPAGQHNLPVSDDDCARVRSGRGDLHMIIADGVIYP